MQLFWWSLYWWLSSPSVVATHYFTFDWTELSVWNYRLRWVDFDNLWTIDTQTFNAPMVDWWWVLGQFYRSKTITFRLSIVWDTLSEVNEAIDNLKRDTRKSEGYLEISVNWTIRRCRASRIWLELNRRYYHLTLVPDVTLTFMTVDPHRTEKTAFSSTETVAGDLTYTVENSGSAPVFPVTYVNFGSGNSGITSVELTYQWQTITITQSFADGDILTIDAVNKLVKRNNTELDFDWVFTQLDVGDNIVDLEFNWGATVSGQLTTLFYKTYY